MARSSTTEMAVMGLLALGAQTGYDIRQECEEKLSHFWQESYGQIYPALNRLHKRGWVKKETKAGKGPIKHLYSLTKEGQNALTKWFSEPVQHTPPRNELLLKIFLGRIAKSDNLASVIDSYTTEIQNRLSVLLHIRDAIQKDAKDHPDAPYWLITLDYGIRMMKSQIEWANEAQRHILEI